MMVHPFRGVIKNTLGINTVQIENLPAFNGYLSLEYVVGDIVELVVRPLSNQPVAKLYQYLYHGVYTPLSVYMKIPVEELDGRMKGLFSVVNEGTVHEYVRDKKNMNKKALIVYIDAVKAYGVALGCDIEDIKEKQDA